MMVKFGWTLSRIEMKDTMNRKQVDQPPYPVGAIANYMLDRGAQDRVPVTHLKLQKLVYMAYGWATAYFDVPLFNSKIEAWEYGPVIPDLWHEFKPFGDKPIKDGRSFEFDVKTGQRRIPKVPESDARTHEVLDLTWELYGKDPAWKLVGRTHGPGTPWSETQRKMPGSIIRRSIIARHFHSLLQEWMAADEYEDYEAILDTISAEEMAERKDEAAAEAERYGDYIYP